MKTKIRYERGKRLIMQGNCSELLVCSSHILARVSNISGKSVDELGELVLKVAKKMQSDESKGLFKI